jgi:hypothetical protein
LILFAISHWLSVFYCFKPALLNFFYLNFGIE